MRLTNRKFWRNSTWPVLLITTFYMVYYPYWDRNVKAWANEPAVWDETGIPIEISTDGRGILDKANELANHPVLIYEFVRNEIEYEPYRGSRFGSARSSCSSIDCSDAAPSAQRSTESPCDTRDAHRW